MGTPAALALTALLTKYASDVLAPSVALAQANVMPAPATLDQLMLPCQWETSMPSGRCAGNRTGVKQMAANERTRKVRGGGAGGNLIELLILIAGPCRGSPACGSVARLGWFTRALLPDGRRNCKTQS